MSEPTDPKLRLEKILPVAEVGPVQAEVLTTVDVTALEAQDRVETVADLVELRSDMGLDAVVPAEPTSALPPRAAVLADRLVGDFAGAARTPEGLLILPSDLVAEVEAGIDQQIKAKRFSLPSLGSGSPTATAYDSKVTNFSTRTSILELASGQKVFSVYNYPLSQGHRWFDQIVKTIAGRQRHKVSSARWKKKFEGKSQVPTIQNDNPDVVLLPYIPNMNAFDLFRNNHDMSDYGELPWAKNLTTEDKLVLGERIITALAKLHADTGVGWGETILQNVIITPEGEPIIVDPEVEFNSGVSPEEQKLDDLKEMIFSMAGAISQSEKVSDVTPIVHRFLTSYPDQTIVRQLCDTTSDKFGFLRRVQLQLHDLNYFGVSLGTYQAITAAIKSY